VAKENASKAEESSRREREELNRIGGFWKAAKKFRRIGGASDVPAAPRTPLKP
jgi:hypothetical protein